MLHATRNTATVALVGYLAPAGADGYRRLYKDPNVELYIEIPTGDIIEVSSTEPGQSLILVRSDAQLVWHESLAASGLDATSTTRGFRWPRP
jgi:hypothetical protein